MSLEFDDRGIIVRPSARALISARRPTVWLVLQDVALEAHWRDGRLVAATSARLVAEHLGLDPGTAAGALRDLRDAGLVELGQASGADGRFGLATYTVHLPDGVETLAPRPAAPRAVDPHTVDPHTVGAAAGLVLSCPWGGQPEPTLDRPATSASAADDVGAAAGGDPWSPPSPVSPMAAPAASPSRSRRPRSPSRRPEQGAFDLGTEV